MDWMDGMDGIDGMNLQITRWDRLFAVPPMP